jgi:hypothetical protein
MFLSDHNRFTIFFLGGCLLLAKELVNFFQGMAGRLMVGYLA